MGLVEVARFATWPEAEVACSALRARGVDAVVFDRHFATMLWTRQAALGGVRLLVPSTGFAAAVEFLKERRAFVPEALKWTRHPQRFSGVPVAILAGMFAELGWFVAALQRRLSIVGLAVLLVLLATVAYVYSMILLGPAD